MRFESGGGGRDVDDGGGGRDVDDGGGGRDGDDGGGRDILEGDWGFYILDCDLQTFFFLFFFESLLACRNSAIWQAEFVP